MKNLFKYNIVVLIVCAICFQSCDQDDSLERTPTPVATAMSSLTVSEGNTNGAITFNMSLSERFKIVENTNIGQMTGAEFSIDVVGGSAEEGVDYDFVLPRVYDVGFEFWGGDGYYLHLTEQDLEFAIPVDDIITINQDSVLEGTETIELLIRPAGIAQVSIDQRVVININDSCTWTLQTVDAYGDGWTGGFITVTSAGQSTNYSAQGTGTDFEIPIGNGADYTFTYTSGGGTGQAPGWEEENTYTLTAPDGTVWTDGPIPAEGEITTGTNSCQ